MKVLLSALILGFGLLISSAQASLRAGTFDDPHDTVPERQKQPVQRLVAPFRYEIPSSSNEAYSEQLHDRAP